MDTEQNRCHLTRVDDVDAEDTAWRDEISGAVCRAEQASSELRRVAGELPRDDSEAWKRFASDVASATLRFDVQLGTAAARLRAEHLAEPHGAELHQGVPSEPHADDPLTFLRTRVGAVIDDLGHLVGHRGDDG